MRDNNSKMSLDIFNGMISKAAEQTGGWKWKRKDQTWWTNHNGQIVPYHEPTHGPREIHPAPHEVDPEVEKPEVQDKPATPEVPAAPAEKRVGEMSWEEIRNKYESHPEMQKVTNDEGLEEAQKSKLRLAIRESLYLEDLMADLASGGKITDEMSSRPFVKNAIALMRSQGDLFNAGSIRKIESDAAFQAYAPRGKLLEDTIAEWPQQTKTSSPRGGWRPLKERTKNLLEKAMDTSKDIDEDFEDTEEGFNRRMQKKLTPEFIADTCVKHWRKYNEEANRVMDELHKRKLPGDFAKGKTREELKELLGEELFNLMDKVAKDTPARNNMNKNAKAIMDRVPGAGWF